MPLKSVYLLLGLLLGTSSGAGATNQRVDEFDVGRFAFCESRQANLGLLARVEAQAGRAHPSLKKWEQANADLVREGIALADGLPDADDCSAAFDAGHELFREGLSSSIRAVRRSQPYEPTSDEDVRRARLDLLAQWIQEEAVRQVLASFPDDTQEPAVQWARAQATTRMKHVAIDSALVVSLIYEDFGAPDPATLGPRAAWQASQLSERYGVPVRILGRDGQGATRATSPRL